VNYILRKTYGDGRYFYFVGSYDLMGLVQGDAWQEHPGRITLLHSLRLVETIIKSMNKSPAVAIEVMTEDEYTIEKIMLS
jgi:hypothetical protein